MHSRRFASLLLGAWLAVSAFVDFAVITNFRSVDRFLNEPGARAAAQIQTIGGKPAARVFLRHEAAEVNRFLFEQWEWAQLALGVALLLVLVLGHGDPPRFSLPLTALMLAIVALSRFWMTPEITRLGRLLDFPDTPGADTALFWKFHGAYSGVELLKLAFGIIMAGTLLIRRVDRKKFVREHEKLTRSRTENQASSSLT